MFSAKYVAAALFAGTIAGWAQPAAAGDPSAYTMHVYKTPWCSCCGAWTDHMKRLGYKVEVTELNDLAQLRKQAGVPDEVQGCHTAAIQDYVVEGHVPPEAIAKLLDERPKDHGISVPGMPQGSVGMGDDPRAQYDVVTFDAGPAANSRVFYRAGH